MNTRWLNKLLLSYLPAFGIITLSILLLTFLTISQISKQSAIKSNELLTLNIMQTIDNGLKHIEAVVDAEIVINQRFVPFYNSENHHWMDYTAVNAASSLSQIASSSPMIHSLYLYRPIDGTVLSSESITPVEAFEDSNFIASMQAYLHPYTWFEVRTYTPSLFEDPVTVISFVRITDLKTNGIMVVNVDVNYIRKLMQGMSTSDLQFVELVGLNGQVMISKHSGDPIVAKNSSLSEMRSVYTGWALRSGIQNGQTYAFMESLLDVWMILGGLLLVLGSIWIVLVSRRNYKPVQQLMARITNYSPHIQSPNGISEKGQYDEFSVIESAVERLIERSGLMEEQAQELAFFRKRKLLQDLLEHSGVSFIPEFQEDMKRYGMQAYLDSTCCATVLVELDRYGSFVTSFSHRDQHLYKEILMRIWNEIADKESLQVWTEWVEDNRIAIVVNLHNTTEISEQILEQYSHSALKWIQDNLPLTITIAIGVQTSNPFGLSKSYANARAVLDYKCSLGSNRVLLGEQMHQPEGSPALPLQHITTFVREYRAGERVWSSKFDEIQNQLTTTMLNEEQLLGFMNYLLYHLNNEMKEMPDEFERIWLENASPSLSRILNDYETSEEILSLFRIQLWTTFDLLTEQRLNRSSDKLILNVRSYINTNYGNPNLSLPHLSEEFGISPSHLSRLFKECFGVKFIDYLTQVRIEESRKLLMETSMAIQDIASQVGYSQSLTFIKVFKKLTGVTPGAYRKAPFQNSSIS